MGKDWEEHHCENAVLGFIYVGFYALTAFAAPTFEGWQLFTWKSSVGAYFAEFVAILLCLLYNPHNDGNYIDESIPFLVVFLTIGLAGLPRQS